jgi:lipoprotein-anchoring transpeptidase ErfK/SrfK
MTADAVRRAEAADSGLHVVVSLDARRVWVLRGRDTLRTGPVAVGRDTTLAFEGHVWTFDTPRGIRYVRRKDANPVWVPPDWHYVESARQDDLRVARLERGHPVRLHSGDLLTVRGAVAGLVHPSGVFDTLDETEEIIFDSTLYIPPLGTRNRRIPGELGRFRLDLGGGYLLHGTPDSSSIGQAATHGCVRLRDADIAWLYRHVPRWTPVYIY